MRIRAFFRVVCIASPIMFIFLFALSYGAAASASASAYYTLDDTGAGCTFGVWDSAALSCTMNEDLIFDSPGDCFEAMQITGDGVTLDGNGHSLTTATGVYPPSSYSGYYTTGIDLDARSRVTLRNIGIRGFETGIRIDEGLGIRVEGNDLSGNGTAVRVADSTAVSVIGNSITEDVYGVSLFESEYALISENTVTGDYYGVKLFNSDHNDITRNIIATNGWQCYYRAGCGAGIWLHGSSHNWLANNLVSDNRTGLIITDYVTCDDPLCIWEVFVSGSDSNSIIANDFTGNEQQVYVSGYSRDNLFSYPRSGNYWSDWTGPDADGDGIVDSPYVFNGGIDHYPMSLRITHLLPEEPLPPPAPPVEHAVNPGDEDGGLWQDRSLPDTGFIAWPAAVLLQVSGVGVFLLSRRRKV